MDFACSICDEIPASVQVITATKILVFLQKMTAMNQDGKGREFWKINDNFGII